MILFASGVNVRRRLTSFPMSSERMCKEETNSSHLSLLSNMKEKEANKNKYLTSPFIRICFPSCTLCTEYCQDV